MEEYLGKLNQYYRDRHGESTGSAVTLIGCIALAGILLAFAGLIH